MPGRFIVIDGPDAAGTTLHTRLLAERLQSDGVNVLLTSEPTEGPVGKWIRDLLKGSQRVPSSTLQLLFTADRAWHVENVILPALSGGQTVITDRYHYSTIAYGEALGLDRDWLRQANAAFPKPDRTIFALPPLSVCLERLARRETRDILEQADLQKKIHEAYRRLAEEDPSIVVVDTSGEKQTIAGQIADAVQ